MNGFSSFSRFSLFTARLFLKGDNSYSYLIKNSCYFFEKYLEYLIQLGKNGIFEGPEDRKLWNDAASNKLPEFIKGMYKLLTNMFFNSLELYYLFLNF